MGKIKGIITQKWFYHIWVRSYILDYENERNPFRERRIHIRKWKEYAVDDIEESAELLERAKKLNEMGFSKFDSLHIACAIAGKCEYFLTTDDRILSYASRIAEIKINDPIGFIKEIRI